jgi:hypothetical protein
MTIFLKVLKMETVLFEWAIMVGNELMGLGGEGMNQSVVF